MATRSNKPEGSAAPKRPRRPTKSASSSAAPELSSPPPAAEAADMGLSADSVVGDAANTVDDSRVAERAYELYVESGWQSGRELDHWLQAEAEIRGRTRR